ncbi:MAG TPA: hypothetical protein VGI20_09840 [Rhizomicrobium sp.]|jgi:hypothetical protein
MRPQTQQVVVAREAPDTESLCDSRGAFAVEPSVPQRCPVTMPDQEIVIWTPARLAGVLFSPLRGLLTSPRLVARTSANDAT